MARSGLKKVVKTVKGKKGTVKRSYWVKAQGAAGKAKSAVGGFARRHSTALKVVGGVAALAGLAYGAHRAPALMASARMARAGYSAAREVGGTRMQALGIAGRAGRLTNRAHGGSEWGQAVGGAAASAKQAVGDRAALAGMRAQRAGGKAAAYIGGTRAGKAVSGFAAPIIDRASRIPLRLRRGARALRDS